MQIPLLFLTFVIYLLDHVIGNAIDSSTLNDPFWKYQWYLNPQTRNYGLNLNVSTVWANGITGKDIKVSIVDSGVRERGDMIGEVWGTFDNREACTDLSLCSRIRMTGHGTRSAGIVSMIANNTQCGVGIAPDSKIVNIPIFGLKSPSAQIEAEAEVEDLNDADIYSNSWGVADTGSQLLPPSQFMEDALHKGTTEGRNGRGAIYVWASGNGGDSGDSCAYDVNVNLRQTIPIAGIDMHGNLLPSTEACSAQAAVAPSREGGGYYYTDPIISPDSFGKACDWTFSKSSAAAPMAAGIFALLLQAKPDLGWRDVQYLVALTSNPCLGDDIDYTTNKAGLKFSNKYGFGLLNAGALVDEARKWKNVGEEIHCRTVLRPGRNPSKRYTFNSKSFICYDMTNVLDPRVAIGSLESVVVRLTGKFVNRAGTTLNVTSPSGTVSQLLPGRYLDISGNRFENHPVSTRQFWGESNNSTSAEWELSFEGLFSQDTFERLELHLYGTSSSLSQSWQSGIMQPCTKPTSELQNAHVDWPWGCKAWGDWSSCVTTNGCGEGIENRKRTCRRENREETYERQDRTCDSHVICTTQPPLPKKNRTEITEGRVEGYSLCKERGESSWQACHTTSLISNGKCPSGCGPAIKKDIYECRNFFNSYKGKCEKEVGCFYPSNCTESCELSGDGRCSTSCGAAVKETRYNCTTDNKHFYERRYLESCTLPPCPVEMCIFKSQTACNVSCGEGITTKTLECSIDGGISRSRTTSEKCSKPPCLALTNCQVVDKNSPCVIPNGNACMKYEKIVCSDEPDPFIRVVECPCDS